jgi:hypothetical protein
MYANELFLCLSCRYTDCNNEGIKHRNCDNQTNTQHRGQWTKSLAKDNISNNICTGESMWNSKVGFTTPVRKFFTVRGAEAFVVNNQVDQNIRN